MLIGMHAGQMTGRARGGSASLLAGWVLLLLGCGSRASPDTELLMQAPFARDLNWTAAAALCNSTTQAADVTCDAHDNVIEM